MQFEWNNEKARLNMEKHSLSFSDAHYVFSGEIITFEDKRENYSELRYVTLGELWGRVIVHTLRGDAIRIISMRKANEREKKIYYKRLKKN